MPYTTRLNSEWHAQFTSSSESYLENLLPENAIIEKNFKLETFADLRPKSNIFAGMQKRVSPRKKIARTVLSNNYWSVGWQRAFVSKTNSLKKVQSDKRFLKNRNVFHHTFSAYYIFTTD